MESKTTPNNINERLRALSDDHRRFFLHRCVNEGYDLTRLPMVKKSRGDGESFSAPATSTQKKLWVLEQINPGNRFNRINLALRLEGGLDIEILRSALDELVAEHESLHTKFIEENGLLRQVVGLTGTADFTVETVEHLDDSWLESTVRRERVEFETAPLDVQHDSLFRVRLLKLAEMKYVLFIGLHHLIADGWSVDIIARQLSASYAARRAGLLPDRRRAGAQPADYALWEEDLEAINFFEEDVKWFRSELDGATFETTIPYDFMPSAQRQEVAGIERLELGSTAREKLQLFIRRHQTTMFAVLLAVTAITLRRFGGKKDLILGVALANRERPDLHETVGALINILPIRLRLEDRAELLETIETTARSATQILTRQSVPFDEILDASGVLRDSSLTPLFKSLFILQNANDTGLTLPGVKVTEILPDQTGAVYDLTFVWRESAEKIYLDIEYAADLYRPETIRQFLDVLVDILEFLPENAGSALREIGRPMLSQAAGFSNFADASHIPEPTAPPIEDFDEWEKQTPDSEAVITPAGAFSYRETAGLVETLRKALWEKKFEPGDSAVVSVTNGLEAVIVMLAIHRAGGHFTFIDRRSGSDYAAQIISDIAPRVYLTDKKGAEAFQPALPVILIDELIAGARQAEISRDEDVFNNSQLTDRAYVAYTSGSTGRPKGIVYSHRSFKQFLNWQKDAFNFAPGTRVAMWSPFVFDACLTEVFGALTSGATLVIPDYQRRHDPAYILYWLQENRIDYFLTIPSFLRLLIEEGEARSCVTAVGDVAVSGEILTPLVANWFRTVFPQSRLHNLYGPTEAILATEYVIDKTFESREFIPVGRPLAGRSIVLLDDAGLPQPPGAVGEICIISDFMADGYLNLPQETARRFSALTDGDRTLHIYRTGDNGRFSNDGILTFFGRNDGQVKIRGSRVEIEAVESVLQSHESVEECAVAAVEKGEDLILVAYLVSNLPPEETGLQAYLLDKLPSYAIPTLFLSVPALPRTLTGKIDRRALPKRSFEPPLSSIFPAGATEQRISRIWAEILGAEIDIDRNFFESGGNSLLAVRLFRLLDKEFPGHLKLVDIFANPTIAALSIKISDPTSSGIARTAGRERANLRSQALRMRRAKNKSEF